MNFDRTVQMPSALDTRTSDPTIENDPSSTAAQLPRYERSTAATTVGQHHRMDIPPTVTNHHRLPHQLPHPIPPLGPVQLAPSPLIRSASAPPDYLPSPAASRQHRATRSHWPLQVPDDDDFRVLPMPPEVVETGRREKECSACCLRCVVVMTTLRWLFVSAALLGAGCVVTGIVFGVMSTTLYKDAFFVLAFIFIGLGIVLVLVVGIGWRCSPAGHEPCHVLCHLTEAASGAGGAASYDAAGGTQRATRLMHRSRNQWYAGFLYPEFRYATPPPSYSTSMQQYRQQLAQHGAADGDRGILGNSSISSLDNLSSLPSSPPPTYRSRIVGRVRPPLAGVMTLSHDTSAAELPPPYQNSSTASSLDRLADVEECDAPGIAEPPVWIIPDISESTDNDPPIVSDPSCHPLEDVVVVEVLATPTTPVAISAGTQSVPDDAPEALPSVRNIVQRFEDLSNVRRTSDLSRKTGQTTGASDHLFNSCSLSGAIESTTHVGADQNSDDEEPRSSRRLPTDQSHFRNGEGVDKLCSVYQSLKTSPSTNQSNVTNSIEDACSFVQSSNVYSVDDQSQLRTSISDGDWHSANLIPDNPVTDDQMIQARSTTTSKSHPQPTSFNDVTNKAHDAASNQSRSNSVYVACVANQSPDSRHIQIVQAANNNFQVSSGSNSSHRDFNRSQSLGDHEIGESGI